MVIWKCIKSHLSYFIVGQGKECTYVYFHILYWFQLCFKTLCKRFKHNIKIPLGANFVWINKSSLNNYQNKIIFQMVRVLVSESESLQCMIIKTQIHQCSPPWMQNQTFKDERMFRNNALTNKFCWDILLHVNEKSKNKVEKDKKNLSIFNEVLANNISQSTASIS